MINLFDDYEVFLIKIENYIIIFTYNKQCTNNFGNSYITTKFIEN